MIDIAELRRRLVEHGVGLDMLQQRELLDRLEQLEADHRKDIDTLLPLMVKLEQYEKALRDAQAELTRGTFTSQLRALDIIDEALAQGEK